MKERNDCFDLLKANYLFQEIALRAREFKMAHPDTELLHLGIGDTTIPLPSCTAHAMSDYADGLGTRQGYSGYGPYNGLQKLRELISERLYKNLVSPEDIYLSDGSKCDMGRLQWLFSREAVVAVQDPAYPAYVDASIIAGKSVVYWPCTPDNDFFPDLDSVPKADLIFFCSPNNPTGMAASRAQLEQLVEYAQRHQAIIVFDAAYAAFIEGGDLPRSIFEIEGAKEVAIESGSFSKLAGFTGVRLGWTVIGKDVRYKDGIPIKSAWERVLSTFFNGASNISQMGGMAVLSDAGWNEALHTIAMYKNNVARLKLALESIGSTCYGGTHAPFVWVNMHKGSSWEVFDYLLQEYHIVTTPGIGFGSEGEGYVRFSGFGSGEMLSRVIQKILCI